MTGKGIPSDPNSEKRLSILRVQPNPAINDVTVVTESFVDGIGTISLYDTRGRRVKVSMIPWLLGRKTISLDVSDLPGGRYELILEAGKEQVAREVIVW